MMIRPAAASVLLLLGVLATAAAAADAEEGRGLRGLVNKIVSPLTGYNPTRPRIDPAKYNPTMPPLDDPNGGRNLRGLVNKIVSPLTNQVYQPTTTIDPVKVPGYNPTRPIDTDHRTHARTDQYTEPFPSPYDPTRPTEPLDPTKTTSF